MTSTRPSSLHEYVVRTVAHRIVQGEMQAGAVLRLEDLSEDLKVSRTVARGATQALAAMGLVTVRPRVGITVQPSEQWDPYDPDLLVLRAEGPDQGRVLRAIGALRLAVEPMAARSAAETAGPDDCARLSEAVAKMSSHRRSDDVDSFLAADVAFHRALLESSGNFLFAGLADSITAYVIARSDNELLPADPDAASIARHADLVAAISSKDPDRAERIARELVTEALDIGVTGGETGGAA